MTKKPRATKARDTLADLAGAGAPATTTPPRRPPGRPLKIEDGEGLVAINVRVTPTLHRVLKYMALDTDSDVSTIIRDALAQVPDIAARLAAARRAQKRLPAGQK